MKRVAYLGDTALPGPASYLAGIMTHYKIPFDYVPSGTPPPEAIFSDTTGLVVLSDYPASDLGAEGMTSLCTHVAKGCGLLMLGGWSTYHGLGGNYDTTPLAELLPVQMRSADDRRNCAQPCLIRKVADHPILAGLPWDRPAGIGGYNEFEARDNASVLLEGEKYAAAVVGDKVEFAAAGRFPLLVVDESASSPRACFATDVAPHWVGGMVDWGDARLTVEMGDDAIEVGAAYAAFFNQLLRWGLGEGASQ